MRWETICFDLDNTLFSHEDAFKKAICYCFSTLLKANQLKNQLNVQPLFASFKSYSDIYWSEYEKGILSTKEYRRKRFLSTISDFQLPFDQNDADNFHDLYFQVVDDFSEPYPDLDQLLNSLQELGKKVGIITNGTADTQYRKVKKLRLNDWISNDCIFISEEVKARKPDRQIFDFAKQRLHSRGRNLFVGDSWEQDVVGAINAGWDAIYLNTRNQKPTTSHVPFSILPNLQEVKMMIERQSH